MSYFGHQRLTVVEYHEQEKGNFSMTHIAQTPAEEIELTDAQLETVFGAADLDDTTAAPEDYETDDELPPPDGSTLPAPAPASATLTTPPHVFFFKKDKKIIFFKKDEKVKVFKIS
jgi:hypothetical protein